VAVAVGASAALVERGQRGLTTTLSAVTGEDREDAEPEPGDPIEDAAWDAFSHASRRGGARPAAGRRIGILFAVLATVALVAIAVIVVVLKGGGSDQPAKDGAATQIDSAHKSLVSHRRTCNEGSEQLDCRRETAEALSLAYRNFNVDLDRITVPGPASEARDLVEEDAELLSGAYDELSVATTTAAYNRILTRDGVAGLLSSFDRHYAALVAAVGAG
jgi:hypothetical protein